MVKYLSRQLMLARSATERACRYPGRVWRNSLGMDVNGGLSRRPRELRHGLPGPCESGVGAGPVGRRVLIGSGAKELAGVRGAGLGSTDGCYHGDSDLAGAMLPG